MRSVSRLVMATGAVALAAASARAAPLPATVEDFRLPGTQPLAIVDPIATPSGCQNCHSGFGEPDVEPLRNWQGSMMAQAGRDPLMWAALAIANQDVEHAGETCLRCHMPKGWLEGRSVPEDGSAMTADDRQGVQCGVCHRMVDPVTRSENPAADADILAGLGTPVASIGSAQYVIDPIERLRGPFDVVTDLGEDPHAPSVSTLLSPYHRRAELCGVCHDVSNPLFTRTPTGDYVPNALGAPADPALGFPEQRTYSEWAASEYARGGVHAPQFGHNRDVVSTCQDCHMPAVSGRDAKLGLSRTDLPLHEMVGANTFVPAVLPAHPIFGGEVDPEIMATSVEKATSMLRRAATVTATLGDGTLAVRIVNETGHKLPTGYPEGRRMWLHVRAFDGKRRVVFESGRYVFATAALAGDPHLKVWETVQGMTPEWAAQVGQSPGASFHLVLNNVVLRDNRIPPRGFTHAAFAAFGGEPVDAAYADGQHWDDVSYPVGSAAVEAEVVLYYQTASRDYVEFLHEANVTNAAGPILHDLWEGHRSPPVAMARVRVDTRRRAVAACQRAVARAAAGYLGSYRDAWGACYATEAANRRCDTNARERTVAAADAALARAVGGIDDGRCLDRDYTPQTLGHGPVCPVPCGATVVLHDLSDLAGCIRCQAGALAGAELEAAYGTLPPDVPELRLRPDALRCQQRVTRAAGLLTKAAARAISACRRARRPADADCATADRRGKLRKATARAERLLRGCGDVRGLPGCGAEDDAGAVAACIGEMVTRAASGFAEATYP